MGKKIIRKILVLTASGMAVLGLYGCGHKNDDFSLDESRTTYIYGDTITDGYSAEDLKGRYGVPDSCDITFDTGRSGLSEISLVDGDVEVSGASRVYVVDYDEVNLREEDIQKMVESVFDKSKGIYCRETGDENMTKEEIQRDIDLADIYRQQAIKEGKIDVAEMYESDISDMKARQEKAPDTYKTVSEYGVNKIYMGTNNDQKYSLWISGKSDDGQAGGISIMYDEAGSQEMDKLAQVEDAVYVETVSEDAAEAVARELQNICAMSEVTAEGEAMDFLSRLGISGMVCESWQPAVRRWQNSAFDTIKMEKDGYVLKFGCQIGDINVIYKDPTAVDNLQTDNGYVMQDGDMISVFIDDDGVFYVSARLYTDTSSYVKKEVSLLSWDDMLKAADSSIAKYYRKYPTAYSKVEFDDVELLYVPEVKSDGGLHYVPAWVFTQTDNRDVLDIGAGFEHISQMVYINAVDGKYIDIVETAKALGTWNSSSHASDETISK